MLIYIYLFSLIVGGALLGASILLGGKDVDGDVGLDGDLDLDADADADLELDADSDLGGQGGFDGLLTMFASLRFWTFFLAFFGLTGLVLDLMSLTGSHWITLALAVVMGGATGASAVSIIRRLSSDITGKVTSSGDYIGRTARVVVPFEGASLGKVRVEIRGSSVDLLATGIEPDRFSGKEEVLIVEMDGPKVRVARLDAGGKGRGSA